MLFIFKLPPVIVPKLALIADKSDTAILLAITEPADNSVDVIVSFETIEHHDKHIQMFNEIKRVLKPKGILIISSPDKLNYSILPNYKNKFHVKELYREEFKELVSRNFSHSKFYYQSIVYGSIIVPENGIGNNFKEFQGDFSNININRTILKPIYNICIASNFEFDSLKQTDNSFFNAEHILINIINKEGDIYNSKTYKLGNFLLKPFRYILGKFFKK